MEVEGIEVDARDGHGDTPLIIAALNLQRIMTLLDPHCDTTLTRVTTRRCGSGLAAAIAPLPGMHIPRVLRHILDAYRQFRSCWSKTVQMSTTPEWGTIKLWSTQHEGQALSVSFPRCSSAVPTLTPYTSNVRCLPIVNARRFHGTSDIAAVIGAWGERERRIRHSSSGMRR